MYKVYLKRGEQKRIEAGHSWVFANEVAKIEGKDKNGSLAEVLSFDEKSLGKGYINHLSKILVRVFIRSDEKDSLELFKARVKAADDMRKRLGLFCAYRVVFAEADDLPALIIDKYDDVFVMQCLSLGMDKRKSLVAQALVELFSPRGIYERSDSPVRKKEGLEPSCGVLYGEVPDKILIEENGLKLNVDVKNGQKTGYFLDQKDNRYALRRYTVGADVLDCFSNSGGFSLNAATNAKSVTAVDVSESALATLKENAALNGFSNVNTVCADVFEFLKEAKQNGRRYDAIILDPPAFCKSADEINDALRGYLDINLKAMQLLKSGGFLITCSCSQHITLPMFEKMLTEAASKCARTVRVLEMKIQAPDHPYLMQAHETQYLKFFVLNVTDKA